jgi:hypothetical protein
VGLGAYHPAVGRPLVGSPEELAVHRPREKTAEDDYRRRAGFCAAGCHHDQQHLGSRRGAIAVPVGNWCQGWASCTIADDQAQAKAIASDITNGPEQLLLAITALALTDSPTRAEFEAEPTVFRWFFQRDGSNVDIRLVRADDTSRPDSEGTVIWSSHQTVDALARAVISGFDQVARELGEDNYLA